MFLDIEYIKLAGSRLEKFAPSGTNRWVCRCPICGDSKKDKNKTRGNFYLYEGSYFYNCFNCGPDSAMGILTFLERVFPDLYSDYLSAKTDNKISSMRRKKVEEPKIPEVKKPKKKKVLKQIGLPRISDLEESHPAVTYLQERKIPSKYFHDLFYTAEFKKWANSVAPNTFKNLDFDEPRIVIPFRTPKGNIFALQGRTLKKSKLKYLTVKLKKDAKKIYGANRVDQSKDIYVVEGPFDSLFVENCIASADGSLDIDGPFVFIWDNEPRNEQIVKQIESAIEKGKKVVIWPVEAKFNDINDAVEKFGYDADMINEMIKERTFSGLSALLELNNWKKIIPEENKKSHYKEN